VETISGRYRSNGYTSSASARHVADVRLHDALGLPEPPSAQSWGEKTVQFTTPNIPVSDQKKMTQESQAFVLKRIFYNSM
jgi:hypothetical protein